MPTTNQNNNTPSTTVNALAMSKSNGENASFEKIKVHLLYFWLCLSSHIEIVLEQTKENKKYFYRISPWSEPANEATVNYDEIWIDFIGKASERHTIEIEANLERIITAWQAKYYNEKKDFEWFNNNCADISAWFLKEFAEIRQPEPCDPPVTINYLGCGLFAPSFVQCCTLPGRVFDNTRRITTANSSAEKNEKTSLIPK